MTGIDPAFISFIEYDLTLLLLLASILIFGYLAIRSKNIRTFQFQISIFIMIWIVGELANALLESGLIFVSPSMQEIGYQIHVTSMVFFGVLLYARYIYASRRGKELIEGVPQEIAK